MGDLESQAAVEKTGEGRYRAVLDPDWAIWGPNGGYLAAIALRAAGAESRFRRPASFLCQYLSVAEFAEVELRVETLRAGRKTQALRVSMHQEERYILEALVWTVAPNQGLVHDFTCSPAVPPPEDLPSMEELLAQKGRKITGFWRNYDIRPIDGLTNGESEPGEPRIRGWYRFRPRARCEDPFADAGRPVVLIDTYTWASVWAAYHFRRGAPFHRPQSGPARPLPQKRHRQRMALLRGKGGSRGRGSDRRRHAGLVTGGEASGVWLQPSLLPAATRALPLT
jgi:hypothetical protein